MIKIPKIEYVESVYDYGCVLLEVEFHDLIEIQKYIKLGDLYFGESDGKHGLESNPHITLLYGLMDGVGFEDVMDILENVQIKFDEIVLGGMDVFENEEYDVIKFNVYDDRLDFLNKILRTLPYENKYPIYSPHVTIAYVNKGIGRYYVDTIPQNEVYKVKPLKITYLTGNKRYHFDLK